MKASLYPFMRYSLITSDIPIRSPHFLNQSHNDALDDHRRIPMVEYQKEYRKLETRYCLTHTKYQYSMGCEKCYGVYCIRCMSESAQCKDGRWWRKMHKGFLYCYFLLWYPLLYFIQRMVFLCTSNFAVRSQCERNNTAWMMSTYIHDNINIHESSLKYLASKVSTSGSRCT